jgi:hypothetical protein
MATVTALEDIELGGTERIYLLTIAMDSSYPSGGEALDLAGNRTIKFLSCPPKGGYVFSWDQDNQKLLAYRTKDPGAAGGADIVLQEVSAATDLSALTDVRAFAIGS